MAEMVIIELKEVDEDPTRNKRDPKVDPAVFPNTTISLAATVLREEERERGTNCGSDEALKGLQYFVADLLGGRVEGVRFSLPLLVGRGDVISKKHAAGEKSNRSKTEDWRVKEGI